MREARVRMSKTSIIKAQKMFDHHLKTLIPDDALRAKVLALFESELAQKEAKQKELEETLHRTIETLRGETREKLRLEEEFRKNADEKFRVAAELAGDYIYDATTDDGNIRALYASPAFTTLTGYTIDDINRGNGWIDFVHPDDQPHIQAVMESISIGRPIVIEYRIRRKDGGTIWLRDFSQPILDEQGRYVKSIGISCNITAEKEAELTLQRERQLLDTLLNTVPVGICLSDEDGTFLRVNRALTEILGYDAFELLGQNFASIVAQDYRELAKEAHRTFMQGDSLITSGETMVQRKDGEMRWVNFTARKFQREDGKWYRVSAAQDITKKRQQEEEIARLLELLARTESLAHIGSWEFDFETYRFTKWSDELFRIYERPLELGVPTGEEYRTRYISPETDERLQSWVNELIRSGGEGEIELPITTHRGNHKFVRLREVIIFHDGKPARAQGMVQDITREKLLEQQKENLMEQLIQAQKMEAIGTLTGGIAHEFNNILSGMLGNVKLLEQKLGNEPKAKKYIERLLALNQRAATIVAQMMGFARKGKYELKPVSLKICVDTVMQILLPATDRRIRFHLDTATNIPAIQGDPVQMEQVILNLAKNAVDAIEPLLGNEREQGHITFRLSFEPIAERFRNRNPNLDNAPKVMLEVRDNGMGIPKEIQSRIFEPFFTTKPVGKGTGLGLPMVHGIVENHNGYLFIESEAGKGTSFCLYFPAMHVASESSTPDASVRAMPLAGAHILVIDDELAVREMLAEYLSDLGATVEVAENGWTGIEKFRAMPKDNLVVILDLNMPDMRGEQVLQLLRDICPNATIFIGTGYLENAQTSRLTQLGATQVLTKPYSLDEITAMLAARLSQV